VTEVFDVRRWYRSNNGSAWAIIHVGGAFHAVYFTS